MESIFSKYCTLKPGKKLNLNEWPTSIPNGELGTKSNGLNLLEDISRQIAELQRRLWAERKHKILVILQGMDTSGKDGTIRHVFRYTNPNGVNVAAFDRPTRKELSYDYLWRVHQRVPHTGEIIIFDRSHYEDIVTVRVNQLQPESVWKKRYEHINAFERMLVDEGTTLIKIFLHISPEEQRKRLQARLEDPEKHWKFDPSDITARQNWPQYMTAYADALHRCNTAYAPWHIIPSDRKWQRNLLVASLVQRTLEQLDMQFPDPHFEPDTFVI